MGKAAVITWNLRASPRRGVTVKEDEEDVASDDGGPPTSTLRTTVERVESCVSRLNLQLMRVGVDRAVAVFQEVPERFAPLLASATQGAWSVVGSAGNHVAIAKMGPVEVTSVEALATSDSAANDRALLADIDGLLPSRVRVVGLHWLDRFHRPEPQRSDYGRPFWTKIRAQWNHPQSPHFIVLGDFNESPYDRSLVSRDHLWAIRDRADLVGRTHPTDGRPPLYNPMWRLLPERDEPPHGTYCWDRPEVSGVRWWHIDQILVSPSVVDELKNVDILVELDGQQLLNKHGKPDLRIASDHLPVIAILGA